MTVNGLEVQTIVAPPYRCELTAALQEGKNRVAVLLHNTLYEHRQTYPTNFLPATRRSDAEIEW